MRSIWIGCQISTEKGPVLRPTRIEFWKPEDYRTKTPAPALHYKTDALMNLALVHLIPQLQNPFASPEMNFATCNQVWKNLDPHYHIFEKSQDRLTGFANDSHKKFEAHFQFFERNMTEVLDSASHGLQLDLAPLHTIIDSINFLENKLSKSLLFNFDVKFSAGFTEKLHYFHSFLFHLRALIASDYNSQVKDLTFQGIKVDSVSDYLPKADYVANDAILYYRLKQRQNQLTAPVFDEMMDDFYKYTHNAVCLVEALPENFMKSMAHHGVEEALYFVEMDWLLGTEAGLLYRIREELYGLKEHYENIFWPDLSGHKAQAPHQLEVSFRFNQEDVKNIVTAA